MATRNELLETVRARLQRVSTQQGLAPVLEEASLTEARSLAETLHGDAGELEPRFLLGWLHWYRHLALPEEQDQQDLEVAVAMFTLCFANGLGPLPEALLPILAEEATPTAAALLTQVLRSTDPALLEAMVQLWQRILAVIPGDHADSAMYLCSMGVALQVRFERMGAMSDLDAAIQLLDRAVQAAPAEHAYLPTMLVNLGDALQARFRRTGALSDLDTAIQQLDRAVQAASADHPNRAIHPSILGNALLARFTRTGAIADVNAAIQARQEALQATPTDHPDRADRLSSLGFALRARFERTGAIAHVDAAIQVWQEALQATPADHPDRADRLSSLGFALLSRFDLIGTMADLDAAIRLGQEAVRTTPAEHPSRADCLNTLGLALRARFRRLEATADVDAAIQQLDEAVQATPADHPDRAGRLSNLGNALLARFKSTGVAADVDAALQTAQEALQATPTEHPDRAGRLGNLGNALQVRFRHGGKATDLNAAIRTRQEAVRATPADHPDRAMYLSNLGSALYVRFRHAEKAADLDAAVSAYIGAVEVAAAAPAARIEAAWNAARLAASSQPGRAAELSETAVLLLPQVAPRRLERSDQHHAVGAFAGLAADAAALALSDPRATADERAVQALRLLEAARAILLSQALHTRSDLTDLRQHHPTLATQFADLRDLLDRPMNRPPLTTTADLPKSTTPADPDDWATTGRHQLAEEFVTLQERIRGLEGFSSFALPPTTEQLLEQAASGPVVVFTINDRRSDVLLLTTEGITSLELAALSRDIVIDQINAFGQALHTVTDRNLSPVDRIVAQATIREILGWLWDAAAEPVLSALGHRLSPPPDTRPLDWPRVWWVPGGLMGLLPIHAAGYHTDPLEPGRRTVLDRVVSSYTPTVGALRHARQHGTAHPASPRSLIVAMSTTPGLLDQGRLPNVPAEAAMLQSRLPNPALLAEPDDSESADPRRIPTLDTVLTHLGDCSIAHFACHGVSDPADPSHSRLLLHDHQATPLTVAALAPIALDQARLAYLSACSTASTPTTELLDEAIHLASAFQLAGFPHVIGTLWPISDAIAVTIADSFYTNLTIGDGTVDTNRAAYALHQAVRDVRDACPATPSLWAAHIHAGA